MERITDLSQVDFPVKLDQVYIRNTKSNRYKEAKGFKAVSGKTGQTEKIFSVVSDYYTLIPNIDAERIGRLIFEAYFEKINTDDLVIFNVTFPETKSFCYIDLINKKYSFNLWEKEVYIPYMRITNSYNRSRSLKFEIGFSRKMCDNGVIFEKNVIDFNFIHYRNKQEIILKKIKSSGKYEKLKRLEKEFTDYMKNLNEIKIEKRFYTPLTAKIFNMKFNIDSDSEKIKLREKKRMKKFTDLCAIITDKYYNDLGSNAYSVFNLATELANNRDFVKSYRYNDYQTMAGKWLREFANKRINNPDDFSIEDYIKDYKYLIQNN